MTSAYNNFKSFMQNLIRLESSERVTLNGEGYRNHYTVDDDAFAVLQSLASDVVNSDEVADLTDAKREVIAFVLHVTTREFNRFLQNMNARYYVTDIFYPQSVEEFCYSRRDTFPLADWVAETFAADDVEEEVEEEAVDTEEEAAETEVQEEISPERAALCSRAAMNLMNALNRRDGSILVISRSGDEPMTVDVDDLLSFSSFDERVEFIANENDEDVEIVEKCLATGRMTFDDDPDDDDDFDDDDTELDDDDDEVSDPLTWEEILSDPRLSCPETYDGDLDDDERDGKEVDKNPRWLRSLRHEFVQSTVRIESARRRHDDKLESMIRADAMDSFLHTAVVHDLLLVSWYRDNSEPLNRAIASFFDALDAPCIVDDFYNLDLHKYVHRRASLNHKRHVAAIRFLAKASDETMRLLYEAIAEGLDLNIKVSGSYINLVG